MSEVFMRVEICWYWRDLEGRPFEARRQLVSHIRQLADRIERENERFCDRNLVDDDSGEIIGRVSVRLP